MRSCPVCLFKNLPLDWCHFAKLVTLKMQWPCKGFWEIVFDEKLEY